MGAARPRVTAAGTSGSGSMQQSRPADRGGEPTPIPPRGAWFMIPSEWFRGHGSSKWNPMSRARRVAAAATLRLRVASTKRGPGAWLSFRREKVPGTASIAHRVTQDAGRRRTIGAVAVLQSSPSRLRRWHDAGTPPYRRRIRRSTPWDATPRGSSPAYVNAPPSRGHATPPATRLMGRRDARPHNADQRPALGEATTKSDTAPDKLRPLSHAMPATKSVAIREIRVPSAMAGRPPLMIVCVNRKWCRRRDSNPH